MLSTDNHTSFPGMNPEALRGSNTGVFIGAQSSESQTLWSDSGGEFHPGYVMTGSALAMFSNRLSFALDFRGKQDKINPVMPNEISHFFNWTSSFLV